MVVIISRCVSVPSATLRAEEVKRVGTSSDHEGATKSASELECEALWLLRTGPADRVSFAGTIDNGSVLAGGVDAESDKSGTTALADTDGDATVSACCAFVDWCIASSPFSPLLHPGADGAGLTTASKAEELNRNGAGRLVDLKARGRLATAVSELGRPSLHVES